jgi:hypothetical protein
MRTMVSVKRRTIQRKNSPVHGLPHAGTPITRNELRSDTVPFSADMVRRKIDAAVKSRNPCRLIEIQVGKAYDGPVGVRAGKRRGCNGDRITLPCGRQKEYSGIDPNNCYARHGNLLSVWKSIEHQSAKRQDAR